MQHEHVLIKHSDPDAGSHVSADHVDPDLCRHTTVKVKFLYFLEKVNASLLLVDKICLGRYKSTYEKFGISDQFCFEISFPIRIRIEANQCGSGYQNLKGEVFTCASLAL
jgi:hypothetical protein